MFSFSLIEKDRAGWDVALGSDQGGNIDGSPVFRKRGFDESGAMREGDYRLGANSAAENQGLNRYVYVGLYPAVGASGQVVPIYRHGQRHGL